MRSCSVYINGIFAGILAEESARLYSFTYDDAYLASDQAKRVCLAMPTTKQRYESAYLFPFFSNMLPEGSNRIFLCHFYHIPQDDDFGLLMKIATNDTIGAITVQPR